MNKWFSLILSIVFEKSLTLKQQQKKNLILLRFQKTGNSLSHNHIDIDWQCQFGISLFGENEKKEEKVHLKNIFIKLYRSELSCDYKC